MKKFLFLLLAIAGIAFVGCSDDDENNAQNKLLEGTRWVYQESESDYLWQETLEFKGGSKCVYSYLEKEGATITDQGEASGTYSYTPPVVTVKVSMDGETEVKDLTVDGDQMFDDQGTDRLYVFKKQ